MDIVLGVSMAPTSVRMLLVEGENADGVTVEDSTFGITTDDDAATLGAADQVISAILGTREGAVEAGHELTSTGVTWTDPVDAAALRDALATRKVENVMLVSSFMAAAALAQTVGCTVGETHTALLFLEPGTATLAIIDAADGSITDVHKELMAGGHSVAELAGMVESLAESEAQPQSVFIVGAGVDVATIKSQLEAVTTLPITAAEEPETALAWGAALASANAPLFASSTAALAYALDPGTGAIDPYAVSPGYLAAPDVPLGTPIGEDDLAYSAVPDEGADAHTLERQEEDIHTIAHEVVGAEDLESERHRGPLVLVGSILAVLFVAAALSLEVALALGIRPSVALLPRPLQNLIIQNPAPAAPPVQASAPAPQFNHIIVPAAPAAPVHAAIPAAPPVPLPAAPPPVPVALPAPAPVPVVAPVPIPVRVPTPVHIPVRAPAPIQMPAPLPVQAPEPIHVAPPRAPFLPGLPLLPGLPGLGIPGLQPPGSPQGPEFHPPGGFGGNPGGFGGPPEGNHGGFGGPPEGNPGGFGGPPGGNPGGFGGPPGGFGGSPGGFGGPPGGNPGGFGGPPGGFGGGPGGFGGPPGGFGGGPGGFGGPPGGFGGGPGGFGEGPGGFGGGNHGGFGSGGGGFGGGGFGGGGFGGGGHSGGFGGGGHGGGGHH